MDRGTWQAIAHKVVKSQTRLSRHTTYLTYWAGKPRFLVLPTTIQLLLRICLVPASGQAPQLWTDPQIPGEPLQGLLLQPLLTMDGSLQKPQDTWMQDRLLPSASGRTPQRWISLGPLSDSPQNASNSPHLSLSPWELQCPASSDH